MGGTGSRWGNGGIGGLPPITAKFGGTFVLGVVHLSLGVFSCPDNDVLPFTAVFLTVPSLGGLSPDLVGADWLHSGHARAVEIRTYSVVSRICGGF